MGPGTFEASSAIGVRPAAAPTGPVKPCGREGAELAATLAGRTRNEVRFLGDRLIPRAGLKTDLIAISPAAVWVVEVGGHPALSRRVEHVAAAVEALAPGLPTFGAFCFARAELPAFRTMTIDGLWLCDVEGMAERLSVRGPVDEAGAVRLARDLGLLFPAC
jgi:hypothetical protein